MTFKDENSCRQSHVALRLGERHYACDVMRVQEIVDGPDIDPCLDGPQILIGMFTTSRGQVPVVDLLGRPPDACPVRDMSLLILEIGEYPISLLADELLDIIEFDPGTRCSLPPGANGAPNDILAGVIEVEKRDYYLLDLERILSACMESGIGGKAVTGEGAADQ